MTRIEELVGGGQMELVFAKLSSLIINHQSIKTAFNNKKSLVAVV